MKVQLIHPQGGSKLSSSGVLPPIGIISLATYLKYINPHIEIELFDGEITDKEYIINNLNGGVLGISTTGANYHNALEIAKKGKEKGMNVILGGFHATIKYKQILKNQDCIDAVIRRDGEIAFSDYVQAIFEGDFSKLRNIRNLSYRTGDSIITNPMLKECEQIDLNNLPIPDYNLLGEMLKEYEKNFQRHSYKKEGFTKFIGFESQKGCAKAEKYKRCKFCARIDKELRRLTPRQFWNRIEELYDSNGKTMIWDFSDSFTGVIDEKDDWLKQVAETKPKELEDKVYFKIFARADELDNKTVDYIKQIGVKEVFIGAESGDQDKLDIINKGLRLEDTLVAVENLRRYNIQTYASFVYGFPGEDSQSLEKTLSHTKEIIERGDIAGIGVRCMFPLAGMKIHSDLIIKIRENGEIELADGIKNNDGYDAVKLQKLWIKYMTNTNLEEITEYHRRMMKLAENYGVKINDEKRLLLL